MKYLKFLVLIPIIILFLLTTYADQDMSAVKVTAEKVAGNVYMLSGQGGNIGVSIGADGVLMIDDQFAPLTEKILASVAKLTDKPVSFLINTHWHFDHTGGNENLGQMGTIIVAHENVRVRMSKDQFIKAFDKAVPASPAIALPVITFTEAINFHWNNDDIRVFHVDPAHTDGDSIIHFTKVNVVHMGDTFFNKMYPFIDTSSGGNIDGVITSVKMMLEMVNDDTKIIPGHGPLSNKSELQNYHDMLVKMRGIIQGLIAEGKSKEEVIAAKPTHEFDAVWGNGFLQPDAWAGIVYDSLR